VHSNRLSGQGLLPTSVKAASADGALALADGAGAPADGDGAPADGAGDAPGDAAGRKVQVGTVGAAQAATRTTNRAAAATRRRRERVGIGGA
jgi:hypothetical protein